MLARLADEAARAHPSYTLQSWVGPVPDDLLQRWAELTSSLRLTTYNAEVNAHMIGVNDALGFQPVARLGDFQKRLARP